MAYNFARGDVCEFWGVPVRGEPDARSAEKERPAVILQNDALTAAQGVGDEFTVIVVPTTKDLSRESPVGLRVGKGTGGLPKESIVLCDQIFTVKRSWYVKKYGALPDTVMDNIELRVHYALGLPTNPTPPSAPLAPPAGPQPAMPSKT